MAGQVISRLTSSGGTDAGVHVISSSFYGTCSTNADIADKEVIISNHNVNKIKLVKGMLLTVKFINDNTAAGLPSLTLFENAAANGTDTPIKGDPLTIKGNIYVKDEDTVIPLKPKWSAGNILTFIYDEKNGVGRWIKISSSNEELIERVQEIEIATQGVVKEVDVEYASSQSNLEAPTTGWQTSAPTYSPGQYIWQRTKTVLVGDPTPDYSDPICISNREINYSSYQYNLVCSPSVIIRDTTTSPSTLIPSAITFSSTRAKENETPVEYISHFRVAESSDGINWTSSFTPVDQSNITYSIANSDSANLVKCTIYDIETQNQIDTQTIPIINSNAESENVYTAFLTDESHTFATTYSAAIDASVSSQFIVYKGSTQVTATITNIDFIPYDGLTVTYSDNTFTVSVNSNLTTSIAQSGTLYITATTSDNNSFEKTFNWSLASMKEEGKAGVNGFNSTTVLLYQRYLVQPSNKPQNISYNFDTHRAIIPQGSLWSDSIPSGTDPCWVSAATAVIEATVSPAIDNIADTEWSDPILLVQDGKDGLSQAKITLYKRALTKPSDTEKPGNLTYTFANGSLTPSENFNGWSLNIPEIGNNTPSPCWITTGVAISAAASDVIDSWAEPVQYIEKNIYSITEYYARNNSSTIAPTNNWSTPPIPTPTQDAKYIWNYELITYTDGTTNATSTGSTVHIAATYGADGKGITGITNYYARTNTPNAPTKGTTSPWSTTPQKVDANNKYLWNYEIVNYTTGDSTETNVHLIGAYGDAGIYPTSITEEYIKTTSSTDEPEQFAPEWDVNPPVWESGKYIWTRSKIIWSDDDSPENPHIDYTNPVLANSYNSIGEIAAAASEIANSASEDARNAVESASQAFATASTAVQYAEVANLAASAAVACANTAYNAAVSAQTSASMAASAATSAQASASAAASSALNAENSALNAENSAVNAENSATLAAQQATNASNSAASAQASASIAASAATSAVESASIAADAATSAQTSAADAARDAASANNSANNALIQLSIVEDVAGTLDWIQKHGTYTATTDTTVQDGTIYFEKQGNDYVPIVEPTGDPQSQGWYVLDISDSQTEYIMAHLAVTSQGLWVLPSGQGNGNTPATAPGYKLLLGNSGTTIYDASGNAVVTYGNNITFANDRNWYIGDDNAFIFYNASTDTLQIGGSKVTIGDKAPKDLLTGLDVSVTQTTTGADITVNGDTVSLTNGQNGATGPQGPQGPQGPKGTDGTSVTVTKTEYSVSTSGSTTPSSWSESVPTSIGKGNWLWIRTTFSDGKSIISKSYVGADGDTGPEGTVTISVNNIDWANGTATLKATLRVNGTVTTNGVTYKWTSNTNTLSLGTGQTLSIAKTSSNDALNQTYNCTVTWADGTQTGSIDLAASNSVKLYADAGFTSADGKYATTAQIEVLPDQILSEVSETYATKDDLSAETRARTTAISQTNDAIALKANSSDVYTKTDTDGLISTEVTNRNAAIQTATDGIRSEVSETYATKTEVRRTDTGSGTVVSSDDAANLPPIALTIHGKSVQDGTPSPSSPVEIQSVEGLNLLDFSSITTQTYYGITFTMNDDGSIHVSGTATGTASFYLSDSNTSRNLITVPAGTYTFSANGIDSGVRIIFSGARDNGFAYFETAADGTRTSNVTDGSKPFTYIVIRVNSGATVDTTVRLQLESGSAAHCWQPYQHVNLMTAGTNLLGNLVAGDYSNLGVTCIVGEDNQITFGGTATSGGNIIIPLEETVPYPAGTVYWHYRNDVAVANISMTLQPTLAPYNGPSILLSPAYKIAQGTNTQGIATIGSVRFYIQNGQTYSTVHMQPTLELTDAVTEFETYQGTATPIPLQGYEVCTDDTLSIDSEGNVTLAKNVGSITYDGSSDETWYVANNGAFVYIFNNDCAIQSSDSETFDGMCDRFAPLTPNQTWVGELVGFSSNTGTNHTLRFTDGTKAMTVSEWKTWLQSNPVTVLYPLATPQTISLGKVDLPSLPSPSFSLHVDALVTPTMDAEWWTHGGEEVGSVYQRTSALEQTSRGFTIRMDGIDGDISDLSGDLSDLSGDLSDLSKDAVLKSKDTWTAWMDVGTDENNDPYLTMGQSGNAFESRLTNRYMSFNEGTVELMRLSGEDGVKADTIRSKYVYIGSWILEQLDNGDMAIKLVGGE